MKSHGRAAAAYGQLQHSDSIGSRAGNSSSGGACGRACIVCARYESIAVTLYLPKVRGAAAYNGRDAFSASGQMQGVWAGQGIQ